MPRVNRQELLQQLEAVAPGLAAREAVQQSSCFVFDDGYVMTFNEEVFCRQKTDLPVAGAVAAAPLLAILQKLPEEEVDIDTTETFFIVKSKNHRRARIRMEAEVLLPIEDIEEPGKWRKLPDGFCEAVEVVQQCAGKNSEQIRLTCIHLHPDFIEACDNYQITRYPLETGLKKAVLVKRDSLKHIVDLGMSKIAESKQWLHFKNPAGLQLSCRLYMDEFPDLSAYLEVEDTQPVTLPGGLADEVEKAEVFSAENAHNNVITVSLRADRIRIKGEGANGDYLSEKKASYEGPPITFMISPKLLVDIGKRHPECEVSETQLKVQNDKYVYVSSLAVDNDKDDAEAE